jgi:hypothetical protein
MTSRIKLDTINTSVVDKIPTTRFGGMFTKDKLSKGENYSTTQSSMGTDKAKTSPDEISYSLDEKSTMEEKDDDSFQMVNPEDGENNNVNTNEDDDTRNNRSSTTTVPTYNYLEDKDVLSVSANSSANFSFHPSGLESNDAYPALYDPDLQAQYEKMKIEEEERKEREKDDFDWAPVLSIIESVKGSMKIGMNKVLSLLESLCVNIKNT